MAKQPVLVELFYDGAWQNVTSDVYVRDEIAITRGRADESSQPSPTQAKLTLAAKYNPENPASALYGKIGRNTPLRITVGTDLRFAGEVSAWIPRVSTDLKDAWTLVTAGGITRRLTQGAQPIGSPLRRFLSAADPPVAYWPLADGEGSVVALPFRGNGSPFVLDRTFTQNRLIFGKDRPAPWLETGVSTDQDSGMTAQVIGMASVMDHWAVDWVQVQPAGSASRVNLLGDTGFEQPIEYVLIFDGANNQIQIQYYVEGNFLRETLATNSQFDDGSVHHIRFEAEQILGQDVTWRLWIDAVQVATNTETLQINAGLTNLLFRWGRGTAYVSGSMVWGHVAVWQQDAVAGGIIPPVADFTDAAYGYRLETAGNRLLRLTSENSITATIVGDAGDTIRMGPQYPERFTDILTEAAETDFGIITDSRHEIGITGRARTSMYNQVAALDLDFAATQVAPPLEPAIDDQAIRNDVTVKRRDGSARQVIKRDGPNSIFAPPAGVGRYDTSFDVNVAVNGQLPDQAGWRLHFGTIGDMRFPEITVDLDAFPELVAAASAVDLGDKITIRNLPASITPDDLSVIVQGYTETIGSHRRTITFNCTPGNPWTVGIYGDGTEGPEEPSRYSPVDSATTVAFAAGTDTALTVHDDTPTTEDVWSTAADLPFDIAVAGVRLRVTAIGAATSGTQTLTVDAAPVNGVIKTVPAGAAVELWQPAIYAL